MNVVLIMIPSKIIRSIECLNVHGVIIVVSSEIGNVHDVNLKRMIETIIFEVVEVRMSIIV